MGQSSSHHFAMLLTSVTQNADALLTLCDKMTSVIV